METKSKSTIVTNAFYCGLPHTNKEPSDAIRADPKKLVEYERRHNLRKKMCAEDKDRIVTIAYEYNRETRQLKYGATIWRRHTTTSDTASQDSSVSCKQKAFVKKCHLDTAKARLKVRPVIVNDVEDDETTEDLHYKIRQLVREHGCRSERHQAPTMTH